MILTHNSLWKVATIFPFEEADTLVSKTITKNVRSFKEAYVFLLMTLIIFNYVFQNKETDW